jgi:hypothetical protein
VPHLTIDWLDKPTHQLETRVSLDRPSHLNDLAYVFRAAWLVIEDQSQIA